LRKIYRVSFQIEYRRGRKIECCFSQIEKLLMPNISLLLAMSWQLKQNRRWNVSYCSQDLTIPSPNCIRACIHQSPRTNQGRRGTVDQCRPASRLGAAAAWTFRNDLGCLSQGKSAGSPCFIHRTRRQESKTHLFPC
jgi:hypothetical protein